MTNAPDQVLAIKRWGEVEVKPGWSRKMNDLAQGFWKAVAQVYHALPLPVSAKQEVVETDEDTHRGKTAARWRKGGRLAGQRRSSERSG
jgi:hypothetical protein